MTFELQLDPRLVLLSPWLWDEKTIAWAEAKVRGCDIDVRVLGP